MMKTKMANQIYPAEQPVYTEAAECRDCFKCIRHCPVKAIRIEDGSAKVMSEECIACGECFSVCPVGAKRVRDDLGQVQELLDGDRRVIFSLAPSFPTEFREFAAERLINGLRRLGADVVSETALGAQQVSANVALLMQDTDEPRLLISSACPTAVEVLRKYYPELGRYITDFLSPVLAHCRMLRQHYGDDIAIVFVGPCIGKKREADRHPELLDAALTFDEVRRLLELRQVNPNRGRIDPETHRFMPEAAEEGALYPVDGGMIAGIKANCSVDEAGFMAVSGIRAIPAALAELDPEKLEQPLFLELLACEGGCVNGPLMTSRRGTVAKRLTIFNRARLERHKIPRRPLIDLRCRDSEEVIPEASFQADKIREALRRVGKARTEDELNCGGCGYDNCRAFAVALLQGKAETAMCVSYMRKLAQKKANALINTMPSGVVMVDGDRRIVECNKRFASLAGPETEAVYEACPGLEGAALHKVVPFAQLFDSVLNGAVEMVERDVRHAGRILHVTVFVIEAEHLVGSIVQDVTEPNVQKEQIIARAQEVMQRNVETVQQIASLLGENAAESEVVLNSIIESFSPETI